MFVMLKLDCQQQPKVSSRSSRAYSSSEWKFADIRLPIGNNNARLDDLQYGRTAASSFKDNARDDAGRQAGRRRNYAGRLGWRAVADSAVCTLYVHSRPIPLATASDHFMPRRSPHDFPLIWLNYSGSRPASR